MCVDGYTSKHAARLPLSLFCTPHRPRIPRSLLPHPAYRIVVLRCPSYPPTTTGQALSDMTSFGSRSRTLRLCYPPSPSPSPSKQAFSFSAPTFHQSHPRAAQPSDLLTRPQIGNQAEIGVHAAGSERTAARRALRPQGSAGFSSNPINRGRHAPYPVSRKRACLADPPYPRSCSIHTPCSGLQEPVEKSCILINLVSMSPYAADPSSFTRHLPYSGASRSSRVWFSRLRLGRVSRQTALVKRLEICPETRRALPGRRFRGNHLDLNRAVWQSTHSRSLPRALHLRSGDEDAYLVET